MRVRVRQRFINGYLQLQKFTSRFMIVSMNSGGKIDPRTEAKDLVTMLLKLVTPLSLSTVRLTWAGRQLSKEETFTPKET